MTQLFPNGVKGLSDSKWSGVLGSAFRLVGLDLHSKPGLIKVAQKLTKHSGSTITELCKVAIPVSDGSKLWFSSESGKVWREVSGTYTLIHTASSDPDRLSDTFSWTFSASVEAYAIGCRVMPVGSAYPQLVYSTSGGGTAGSTTLTVSAVVPSGSNRVLVVFVSNIEASADDFTSMTFNGVAMTQLSSGASALEGVDTRWGIYYLINPDATTANIVCTWAGSTTNRNLHAMVFTGAHQTTPLAGVVNSVNNTDATSWLLDVPGSADYQTRVAYVISEAATHTQASTQTLIQATASGSSYNYSSAYVNDLNMGAAIPLGAGELEGYVYYALQKLLFRIPVASIGSAWGNLTNYGVFSIGDTTYHPFAKANNSLFIGDKTEIAQIDISHTFSSTTEFNLADPEQITDLTPYDIDLLVGTADAAAGRVLRWDTVSDSWSGQDDTPGGAIKCFIRDDNYVYALVGDFGELMFYNGEKLETFQKIPGDYSSSAKIKINRNAVGFLLGVPVFGLSNNTGNPVLQGIYSFGSYSKNYDKILDLTYPISSGEFSGMEIGAIIIDGADLYASWKGAATVGVDKLDYTAKYTGAYLETRQLFSGRDRKRLKTMTEFSAEYASMPANCAVVLKYDRNYTGSYTTLTSVKDTNLMQTRAHKSVNKIGALQLRADFTVSSNNAPEIEDFSYETT